MTQQQTMTGIPSPALLKDIAQEYGTPVMVYDEDGIRARIRAYLDSFRSDRFETQVLYASKVFLCRHMAKLAAGEGMHFDAVSGGEVACLKAAGIQAEKIHFHGNNKTPAEIREFFRMGTGHIIVDNEDELNLIRSISRETRQMMNILFRINPGVEAHTHAYIATANKDSKFGISSDNMETIARMAKTVEESEWLHFSGFHSHIGSQIFQVEAFEKEISVMFGFMKQFADRTGFSVEEFDMGGGFAIRYTEEDKPPQTGEICRRIIRACEQEEEKYRLGIRILMMEPGRSIVGESGHTIYTAGCRKSTATIEYIFADGGMADNIRPALYEAEYRCTNISRMEQSPDRLYTIAGKCCESGDIIIRDAKLPETLPGDLLLIHATGAYGYSMASNYNRLGRPPVIFIRDGRARCILRRETYEDMMSLETE